MTCGSGSVSCLLVCCGGQWRIASWMAENSGVSALAFICGHACGLCSRRLTWSLRQCISFLILEILLLLSSVLDERMIMIAKTDTRHWSPLSPYGRETAKMVLFTWVSSYLVIIPHTVLYWTVRRPRRSFLVTPRHTVHSTFNRLFDLWIRV